MAESVVFEVTEDRHARKKKKRPGKSRVPFFLVCIPPFLIINYIIFRLATAQPDFTLTIGDAENYRKVPVEVSLSGRLPMELSVMYDDEPLELPETGNKVYSGFVEKNGTLEVRVRLFNGMEKTQYERISAIDEEPPSIIGEELDRTLLTVSFADDLSGVDFGTGASTLLVTAMAPTDCTLYAVLDNPEGPVVSQLRIELPGDVKPAVFRAPIQAEGVHDLYLITDGEMKLYSWQVK